MKHFSRFLAIFLVVLGLSTPAKAQQDPSLSRPTAAVRGGAVSAVQENAGGLVPYVEVQSRVNFGKTPLGAALYGGFSYERSEASRIVCITGPCPDDRSRQTHLDLATGFRFGLFPRHGPVDAFVGVASHFVHRRETSNLLGDARAWEQRTTIEGGTTVRIPVTERLGVNVGVLGLLPIRVGGGAVHIGEWKPSDAEEGLDVNMSRIGVQVGVQYEL